MIGARTIIEPSVRIVGPEIIGTDCQIEHGAVIGPNSFLSNNCSVGHASVIATQPEGTHVRPFTWINDDDSDMD